MEPSRTNYFSDVCPKRKARFEAFDKEHPHVYARLLTLARQALRAGFERYSICTLWQILRWHSDVEARFGGYKLNNDFSALYARKIMAENPEFHGFFELRKCRPRSSGGFSDE